MIVSEIYIAITYGAAVNSSHVIAVDRRIKRSLHALSAQTLGVSGPKTVATATSLHPRTRHVDEPSGFLKESGLRARRLRRILAHNTPGE
jgi:hypothetical protein